MQAKQVMRYVSVLLVSTVALSCTEEPQTGKEEIMDKIMSKRTMMRKLYTGLYLTTNLTCRYEPQRKSGRLQRFVRFCCYVPKFLACPSPKYRRASGTSLNV